MLDFSQFKRLKDFIELKSHTALKFVILPENLKSGISYKTLLSEATWSDLGQFVSVMHIFKDGSAYFSHFDELECIDVQELYHVAMIAYDEDDREEFIATFENAKALEGYLASRLDFRSDAVYLELNDEMIKELAAKTREAQLNYYDQKIAKAELDINLATKALKKFEELKEGLTNEIK